MTTPAYTGKDTAAPVHFNAPDEIAGDSEVSGFGRDTSAPVNYTSPGGGVVRSAGRAISPRTNAERIAYRLPRTQRFWKSEPSLGAPGWLSDRRIVIASWLTSLVFISLNERNSGYILPRPLRLWSASGLFILLAAAGTIEAVVPLVNALAIGYTVVLAMQYYDNTGQFGPNVGGGAGGAAPGSGKTGGGSNPPPAPSSPPLPFNGTPGFPGGVI